MACTLAYIKTVTIKNEKKDMLKIANPIANAAKVLPKKARLNASLIGKNS